MHQRNVPELTALANTTFSEGATSNFHPSHQATERSPTTFSGQSIARRTSQANIAPIVEDTRPPQRSSAGQSWESMDEGETSAAIVDRLTYAGAIIETGTDS